MGKSMLDLQNNGKQVATLSDADLLLAMRNPATVPGDAVIEWGDVKTLLKAYLDTIYVTGSAQLASAFVLNAGNGVFQDTGLSVTLPAAGTYIVDAVVRGVFYDSAVGGYISAKLYNSTDAADVANTNTLVLYDILANATWQTTVPIMTTVTVNASKVIKLYASRSVNGTPGTTQIDSNNAGRTSLRYVRIF